MKDNLQEKITQLLRKLGVISAFEGFQNFVGFFDEVGSERLMGLLSVPRTSVRGAQSSLDVDELFKPLARR